jgi:hypothetical protein
MPPRVDTSHLNKKRSKPHDEPEELEAEPPRVSNGPIDKVIDLAFNPSRDKIREVTIIDRLQGRLFPIMDTMNSLYRQCIEVATYRMDKDVYKKLYHQERPKDVDCMDEMMFRVAQWQKSVGGKNLEKATDIALAETETGGNDNDDYGGSGRGYEE